MLGHSGRDQRVGDMHAVAVEMQRLLVHRNDDLQRPFRNIAEGILVYALALLLQLRFELGFVLGGGW